MQSDDPFHIVIFGDKSTFESISKIAESKLAGDRPIEVEYIDEVEDLDQYIGLISEFCEGLGLVQQVKSQISTL